MSFGHLGHLGSGLGRLGSGPWRGGGGPAAPSSPVLSLISESSGLVSLAWDLDDTVAAGDTLTRQVQASGGNWSSLVDNTSHVITSGENSANKIDASLSLGNGTWDIRGSVTSAATGKTSSWSNTLTITITDASTIPATALYWGTADLQWGAGNNITWG